ncbi:hypothetical protein OHB41_06310 [Streptomyces sp. NBC_01571]|uniref:hypothetical protein n=1 Tax=Streptomyces sp. NBC_01571 TaxID=2975883 RepID=UPI0022502DBD|nr:hypothetical protein [Streptomyces sp. NBC_01571]MCX4572797.1 hypothetical protein [Streptomyces sp. NBC_01571]
MPGIWHRERLEENAGVTGAALSGDDGTALDTDTDAARLGVQGVVRDISHPALVGRRPTLPPRDRAPPCDAVPRSRAVAFAGRRPVSSGSTPVGIRPPRPVGS